MSKSDEESMIKEEGLTYDDYAELPEDGPRYELVGGKLELMSPSPSSEHQIISHNVMRIVDRSCLSDYLILHAPIDVILSLHEVRQPDIVIVHRNRASLITHRGIEGPPDLIVEILSISTALKDKKIKREVYARFGVPEYWIIDPIYRLLEQNILNETGNYTLHQVYREGDRGTGNLS